jgi:hypothetical protein
MSEERCLQCDINDIVRGHIEAGDAPINLPDLIAKMSESLADLIKRRHFMRTRASVATDPTACPRSPDF